MSKSNLIAVVEVLGVSIAATDQPTFLKAIADRISERTDETPGAFICFRDVNGLVQSKTNPALADAHRRAFLNAPDGAPVAWLARRRSAKLWGSRAGPVERLSGPDMMLAVCRAGVAKGHRHFFLGASDEVLKDLTTRLQTDIPGLEVAGSFSPPFRVPTVAEEADLLTRIRAAGTDLLWVGLGCPKQEIWMAKNAPLLAGTISLGVGAAFDIHAGRISRAPSMIRRSGFEWVWRVIKEPRRLGPRYAAAIPKFFWQLAQEEFGRLRRRPV